VQSVPSPGAPIESDLAPADAAQQADFTALLDASNAGLAARPSRALQETLEPVQAAMSALAEMPELPGNATPEEVRKYSLAVQRAGYRASLATQEMNLLITASTKTLSSILQKQ
jgi:hypothetical protein